MLCSLILKLLAKNADDRYQSAFGLKLDLKQCLDQLLLQQPIADFDLGTQDISSQFSISQKRYGREKAWQAMLGLFHQAAAGRPAVACCSGMRVWVRRYFCGICRNPCSSAMAIF
ncbi:MAG: hypothetical protein HC860_11600 [Alkalinema sp. RU_4_3]|nr:hypothetical protein [Alkalinema sp. RU_4_3]